jgi:hypothetical protein
MFDHPPHRGKTLRRHKTDNRADRRHADFAATIVARTPQSLPPPWPADRSFSSAKAEHALWRAFLADEIDAILFDRD